VTASKVSRLFCGGGYLWQIERLTIHVKNDHGGSKHKDYQKIRYTGQQGRRRIK
jgi:hypothetical protein